jgi:hypothetical protein
MSILARYANLHNDAALYVVMVYRKPSPWTGCDTMQQKVWNAPNHRLDCIYGQHWPRTDSRTWQHKGSG